MDINKFSSLYKSEGVLSCPESGLRRQVLVPGNCFNPLIVRFRCGNKISEINTKEQNEKFYPPLSALREAIEKRPLNLEAVLEALWGFYDDVFMLADKREFQDFLKFDGIFSGCSWFKNSNLKDFPQDLICIKENLPEKMKFDVFLEKGERPKNMLAILFDGRQDKDTTEIPSLKFENPFSRILTGEFSSSEAEQIFDNAKDCLNDDAFKAQCRKGKGKKKSGTTNVDERTDSGYPIPDYINLETIPLGKNVIASPIRYGVRGFANAVRNVLPESKERDYTKPIVTAAEKYLDETGTYLVHYDSGRREYWTAAENKKLFERKKQGRKKRE
jgi:hypothetical protein